MRIGILGGTFNPVHLAHIHWAREYRGHFALDQVLLIPTSTPPHKETPELAGAHHRLEMCRLALREEAGIAVSGYEIKRGGISYTRDTLRYFHKVYPDADICLLMGADMFLTIQQWRGPREIFRLATLCACARAEGEYQKMLEHKPKLEAVGARCELISAKPMPMSSTEIRQAIKEAADMRVYLHPAVWEYICEHGLYGA